MLDEHKISICGADKKKYASSGKPDWLKGEKIHQYAGNIIWAGTTASNTSNPDRQDIHILPFQSIFESLSCLTGLKWTICEGVFLMAGFHTVKTSCRKLNLACWHLLKAFSPSWCMKVWHDCDDVVSYNFMLNVLCLCECFWGYRFLFPCSKPKLKETTDNDLSVKLRQIRVSLHYLKNFKCTEQLKVQKRLNLRPNSETACVWNIVSRYLLKRLDNKHYTVVEAGN